MSTEVGDRSGNSTCRQLFLLHPMAPVSFFAQRTMPIALIVNMTCVLVAAPTQQLVFREILARHVSMSSFSPGSWATIPSLAIII